MEPINPKLHDQSWWIDTYEKESALWIHDGLPNSPHAELTNGGHSSGFFNSSIVVSDSELLQQAAFELFHRLSTTSLGYINLSAINRVIGPQKGATLLAEYIAQEITSHTGTTCDWASPAKRGEGDSRTMVFNDPNRTVKNGEIILPCEDVITTGGSDKLTADAITLEGGQSLNYILVLVNRSGLTEVNNKQIIALITKEMPIWTPRECPLCKAGSKAIRPKDNWEELTAK